MHWNLTQRLDSCTSPNSLGISGSRITHPRAQTYYESPEYDEPCAHQLASLRNGLRSDSGGWHPLSIRFRSTSTRSFDPRIFTAEALCGSSWVGSARRMPRVVYNRFSGIVSTSSIRHAKYSYRLLMSVSENASMHLLLGCGRKTRASYSEPRTEIQWNGHTPLFDFPRH